MKTEIAGNGDMFTFEGSIPTREQARAATPMFSTSTKIIVENVFLSIPQIVAHQKPGNL